MAVEETYEKYSPFSELKQKMALLSLNYLPEDYSLCNSLESFKKLLLSIENKKFDREMMINELKILFLGNIVEKEEIYKICEDEAVNTIVYDGMTVEELIDELLK